MRLYKFLTAEFGMKGLREKRLKISTLDELNDPFDLLPYEMRKPETRRNLRSFISSFARAYGIVCFSSGWKDPVVWAHYSDKHKGLCLGFEVPKRFGMKVRYVKRRLPFPEHQVLSSVPLLFTKYANWSYEEEVRCFRPLLERTKLGEMSFMDFGDELKLVEVIAGARCKVTESEIRSAVKPLKGVKFIKARAGFRRFEVVANEKGFPSQLTT
jgi:hypothetical protein